MCVSVSLSHLSLSSSSSLKDEEDNADENDEDDEDDDQDNDISLYRPFPLNDRSVVVGEAASGGGAAVIAEGSGGSTLTGIYLSIPNAGASITHDMRQHAAAHMAGHNNAHNASLSSTNFPSIAESLSHDMQSTSTWTAPGDLALPSFHPLLAMTRTRQSAQSRQYSPGTRAGTTFGTSVTASQQAVGVSSSGGFPGSVPTLVERHPMGGPGMLIRGTLLNGRLQSGMPGVHRNDHPSSSSTDYPRAATPREGFHLASPLTQNQMIFDPWSTVLMSTRRTTQAQTSSGPNRASQHREYHPHRTNQRGVVVPDRTVTSTTTTTSTTEPGGGVVGALRIRSALPATALTSRRPPAATADDTESCERGGVNHVMSAFREWVVHDDDGSSSALQRRLCRVASNVPAPSNVPVVAQPVPSGVSVEQQENVNLDGQVGAATAAPAVGIEDQGVAPPDAGVAAETSDTTNAGVAEVAAVQDEDVVMESGEAGATAATADGECACVL